MSQILRSFCIDAYEPKEPGPILAVTGTYNYMLHIVKFQYDDGNKLTENSSGANTDQPDVQGTSTTMTTMDNDSGKDESNEGELPMVEFPSESLESVDSGLSSTLSSTLDSGMDTPNDFVFKETVNQKEGPGQGFSITHELMIKPSVSTLSSPPVALALDRSDLYVAEYVKTRVLNIDSNISSKSSPVETISSVKHLYGEDYSTVQEVAGEMVGAIIDLQVTRSYLIVIFENSIQIFRRKNNSLVANIPTQNSLYSTSYESNVVAYQDANQPHGCITVRYISEDRVVNITGHKNKATRFCLNRDGTLLASTSKFGTLIKVFHIESQQKLKEMRRGYKSAVIYNMTFSHDSTILCAFSSSGLHLFSMGQSEILKNTFSSLYALSYIGVTAYGNEWAAKKDSRFANILGRAIFDPGSHTKIHFISSMGEYFGISFDNQEPSKQSSPNVYRKPLHQVFDSDERRLSQTQKMKKKYPDRVPLLVIPKRLSQSQTPILCRNKMMIPAHMNCDQLKDVIGKHLHRVDENIRLWIGGSLRSGHIQINHLYDKYANESGFLIAEYDFVNP